MSRTFSLQAKFANRRGDPQQMDVERVRASSEEAISDFRAQLERQGFTKIDITCWDVTEKKGPKA